MVRRNIRRNSSNPGGKMHRVIGYNFQCIIPALSLIYLISLLHLHSHPVTTTSMPDKLPTAEDTSPSIPTAVDNSLPRCDKLMQNLSSPFADGAFLTRRSTQLVWKMRQDGSRELTLPLTCQLKRQCLKNKSLVFIGDSLMWYMYYVFEPHIFHWTQAMAWEISGDWQHSMLSGWWA